MPNTERLHALDAVRGFALFLGVVLHGTMSFFPDPQIWLTVDAERSPVLSATFFVIHIFRMATFFLLAGFFGRMAFHRKGAWTFIKDRAKRIALPLVAFWPFSMGLIIALMIWSAARIYGWPLPADLPPPPKPDVPFYFPLTHLWFLYVLIWFYAIVLVSRGAVVLFDRKQVLRNAAGGAVAFLVKSNLAPAVLAAPVAAALLSMPFWVKWFGVPTPDQSLLPNAPALATFFSAFCLGWLLHRRIDLLQVLKNRWFWNLTASVALIAACLYMAGPAPELIPAAKGPETQIFAALYALAIWTTTFALIGLGLKFLDRESPAIRYLADSSYWIYIVHLPLVVALQIAVNKIALPAEVKFAGILIVAFAIMLASYQYLVRYSFIGAMLNGRKRRPGVEDAPVMKGVAA